MTCSVSLPLELIPKEQVTQEPDLSPLSSWLAASEAGQGGASDLGLHDASQPTWAPAWHLHPCGSLRGKVPFSRSGTKNVRLRKCPSLFPEAALNPQMLSLSLPSENLTSA